MAQPSAKLATNPQFVYIHDKPRRRFLRLRRRQPLCGSVVLEDAGLVNQHVMCLWGPTLECLTIRIRNGRGDMNSFARLPKKPSLPVGRRLAPQCQRVHEAVSAGSEGRFPPNMASSHRPSSGPHSETITTSFLLFNLHCPTCITTIKEALQDSCADHIRWVSPNVVTSVVTVEHDPAATIGEMESALEEAGFDVCGITTSAGGATDLDQRAPTTDGDPGEGSAQGISRPVSALVRWINPKAPSKTPTTRDHQAKVHLQNCEKCRTSKPHGADKKRSFEPALPSLTALDKTGNPEQPAKMSSKSFITVKSDEAPPKARRRATLAVGGMTCAVCVNTITGDLSKRDWVSKVVVSLVTNSAIVEFNDEDKVGQVVEAIEDLGYEATVDTIVNLDEEKPPS
ncbi:putative copper-transporting atpase 1 protein [Ilyonectria robusta]